MDSQMMCLSLVLIGEGDSWVLNNSLLENKPELSTLGNDVMQWYYYLYVEHEKRCFWGRME